MVAAYSSDQAGKSSRTGSAWCMVYVLWNETFCKRKWKIMFPKNPSWDWIVLPFPSEAKWLNHMQDLSWVPQSSECQEEPNNHKSFQSQTKTWSQKTSLRRGGAGLVLSTMLIPTRKCLGGKVQIGIEVKDLTNLLISSFSSKSSSSSPNGL